MFRGEKRLLQIARPNHNHGTRMYTETGNHENAAHGRWSYGNGVRNGLVRPSEGVEIRDNQSGYLFSRISFAVELPGASKTWNTTIAGQQ